jgi:C1A family cysteine protease
MCPPVYEQGDLGSCTANAGGALYEFVQDKSSLGDYLPSRLFVYYNTRVLENTVSQDSGASLRDTMKAMASKGACHEKFMPYDIQKFARKPTKSAYTDGLKHLVIKYLSIAQDLDHLKSCLVEGYPFVFGMSVYESFESDAVAKTGILPMPGPTEGLIGGHAVMAVGYDDSKKMFIIRNSWGAKWGLAGYFMMPYAYITSSDLCSDFWTIRQVEATKG